MSDIRQWLEELGLGQYADAFEANEVRLEHVPDLTHDVLKELGVAVIGHRMTMLKAATTQAQTTCTDRGEDRYDRTLAICYLGDLDLNAWMVTEGWALAYRHYSLEYVPQEDAARAAVTGMWRGRSCRPGTGDAG